MRPDWDTYFLDLAEAVSTRATCNRGKAGCVIVRDNRIVATGYVGSPPGLPHCDEAGHLFSEVTHPDGETRQHCVRTIHAEQNAICQAARHGVALEGCTIYIKMTPCRVCAMLLAGVGIRRVVAARMYQAGQASIAILEEAGVQVDVLDLSVLEYERSES